MSEIKNVTGTAFIIAEFKAEETKEAEPIYTDFIIKLFLNDETKKIADQVAKTFPAAKEMVKIRTKYFDDVLSEQISQGCQQVVILGSGLDTRAVRKKAADVAYFEIDHLSTLQLKQDILKQNKIAADVCYIPGDYVKDNFIKLLRENSFNFNAPTFILWEGNTAYLQKEAVNFVLEEIRDNIQYFKLSLDYMSDQVIAKTTGYQEITDYMTEFEKMGAPWVTGFAGIENLVKDLNIKVVENFSTAELHKQYRPNRSLESNLFKFYFVCTLENF